MKCFRWIPLALFLCANSLHAAPFTYANSTVLPAVQVIDNATTTVVTVIPLGAKAATKAVATQDGTRVFVGDVTGKVNVIDTQTNTVVGTIALPSQALPFDLALSPNGNTLFVSLGNGSVVLVNAVSPFLPPLQVLPNVGLNPLVTISPDGNTLLVTSQANGSVQVFTFNPVTLVFTLESTITDPLKAPNGAVFKTDGSVFFVIDAGLKALVPFDAHAFTAFPRVCLAGEPENLISSVDGSVVFVSVNTTACNCNSGAVVPINTANFSVTQGIKVGTSPKGLAVTADGQFLYVGDANGNNLFVVALPTFAVTSVPVGPTDSLVFVP